MLSSFHCHAYEKMIQWIIFECRAHTHIVRQEGLSTDVGMVEQGRRKLL